MSFATEIAQASQASVQEARGKALAAKLPGAEIGAAALEGKWISLQEVMFLPCVMALTADDRSKAHALLKPYADAGWMIEPGAGVTLDAMLKVSRMRLGDTGAEVLTGDNIAQLATNLRIVDGLIEDASLFAAHGQPTAEKSKNYDGIAVKFDNDHLCADQRAAVSATERRAIARSTMLQDGEAKMLSKEIGALNAASYFQYVEAYLQQRYSWEPSYLEVEGICYVSKEPVRLAWEMRGTASRPGGAIDTFTKPTKATGHLMYAVKPDGADSNAATDPGKCKRLLYHFEALLADPAVPPAGDGWAEVKVDDVLKVAKLKPGMEAGIRAAAVPCYYRTGAA